MLRDEDTIAARRAAESLLDEDETLASHALLAESVLVMEASQERLHGEVEPMTRIIGGNAGDGGSTRRRSAHPTDHGPGAEALFSAIESWCGSLQGLRFLDLYAGSGAVGLEAWSRGAGVVSLVESDRRTARLIYENAKLLGFSRVHVMTNTVAAALSRSPSAPYDVVFMDPPYHFEDAVVGEELALLSGQDWLVPARSSSSSGRHGAPSPPGRRASPTPADASTARPRFGTVTRPGSAQRSRRRSPRPSQRPAQ